MLKLTGKRPLLAIRIKGNRTHSYLSDLEPGNRASSAVCLFLLVDSRKLVALTIEIAKSTGTF